MNFLSTQIPLITLHLLTPTPVTEQSIPNTLTLYYFFIGRDAFPYKNVKGQIYFSVHLNIYSSD